MPEAKPKYKIVRADTGKTPIGLAETSNKANLQTIAARLNKLNPLRRYSVEPEKTTQILQSNLRTRKRKMPKDEILEEIKTAFELKEKFKISVLNEMTEQSKKMILWKNNMCADWSNYSQAENNFAAVMEKHFGEN